MSEPKDHQTESEREIRDLQRAMDQSVLRRAAELTIAEKLRLGADLYDEGIRWLRQIIKAERPDMSDEQIDQELDRRKAIKRRIEERGLFRPYSEDTPIE
mgnify:CR=1 FL=1